MSDRSRISRRQALGRISAVVGAGTAAWVVPEILTAKPAAGAVLSGPVTSGGGGGTGGGGTGGSGGGGTGGSGGGGGTGGGGTGGGTGGGGTGGGAGGGTGSVTDAASTNGSGTSGTAPKAVTSAATTSSPEGALAFTGFNLQLDAEIGAALIAGGWAMHYWASRTQKERPTP